MHNTAPLLASTDFPPLHRARLATLQVNLGYRCNQSCVHCHLNTGPQRKEMMDMRTLALIPRVLAARHIAILDLTGGAPELHPGFRDLVMAARHLGVHAIDRCNLTVLLEPGQEDLDAFLATHQVEVVASLPCYNPENVERQRGKGVFEKSIAALKTLNALGYGMPNSPLKLNLVYNPAGATLPPPQAQLEADYKRSLYERFGIVFRRLYTLTNMPINRFGSWLVSRGEFASYMRLLKTNFSPDLLKHVMCRTLISVDWQGRLYDCDFNQQLGLPLGGNAVRPHLRDLLTNDFTGAPLAVADHCYGCTAGQGSSYGGALVSDDTARAAR
ncbi:MAG: arsenosugar biosynthesis radical SAM protein ArsS [Candidatus Binatia bacterium]|nr:arsenosugar biosynthesis radical SAM protein ArsS [Candidatus Binatia bacterium]